METSDASSLTPSTILSEVERLLEANGYAVSRDVGKANLPVDYALLAEDQYGFIGIVVYETWSDLKKNWADAQSALVKAIGDNLGQADPKAWDGYLVLMTPAIVDPDDELSLQRIRRDTSRVRKFVSTGDQLSTLKSIRDSLHSLLPLEILEVVQGDESMLDVLPDVLEKQGVDKEAVKVVIDAFRRGDALIKKLAEYEDSK